MGCDSSQHIQEENQKKGNEIDEGDDNEPKAQKKNDGGNNEEVINKEGKKEKTAQKELDNIERLNSEISNMNLKTDEYNEENNEYDYNDFNNGTKRGKSNESHRKQ